MRAIATRTVMACLALWALSGMVHASPYEAHGCMIGNNGHYTPCSVERVTHDRLKAESVHVANRGHVVAHPRGCPWRLFCGCGVSVKIFGHPVRRLYSALAYRRFAPVAPAHGMAAWRHRPGGGHVVYIIRAYGNGTALVYDPNSGHHLTRIHTISLRRFHVVDPHRLRLAER